MPLDPMLYNIAPKAAAPSAPFGALYQSMRACFEHDELSE